MEGRSSDQKGSMDKLAKREEPMAMVNPWQQKQSLICPHIDKSTAGRHQWAEGDGDLQKGKYMESIIQWDIDEKES